MHTRQGDDEVVQALNAASGDVIWHKSYPAPFEMNPFTARHGAGPKSTPTFAGGRLFTFGKSGIVTTFEPRTGRLLWQTAAPPVQPLYHAAMSPLVDGDLVILHVGGDDDGALTAFDVATGDVRWSWDGDGPAYGSPMVFELEGTRQVVSYTRASLVGLSVASGELLWRRPGRKENILTQTPILYRDTLIEAMNAEGITAFRVSREGDEWRSDDVWHTDEVSLFMANSVVIDDVLFGLSHLKKGQYFGLDLDTGQVLWTSDPRQADNAAILRAGDTIFSLEDDAELVIFRGSRTGFEPLVRYEVASRATWAQPTISGNRVFVKDVSTLALWTIE